MRIVSYAINGVGLGHLARLIAIDRAMRRLPPGPAAAAPDHDPLFLTSSPALHLLDAEGIPFVSFPSDEHLAPGGGLRLPLRDKTYSRLLHGLVAATIDAFDPHLFLVDTVPEGVRGELAQVATTARRKVFVLRERAPLDPATAAAINRFDHVLVPHESGPTPAGIDPERLTFTGPILLGDAGRALDRESARARLGLRDVPGDAPVVGVAFGGGGDAGFADLVDWILRTAERNDDLHFAVSLPPLFAEGRRVDASACSARNVRFIRESPMADLWTAFDAVVSAAGYNSWHELLHLGIPTVFVPLARPLDDQAARARRAELAGAALVAAPGDDGALDAALTTLRDVGRCTSIAAAARRLVPGNGASVAARRLVEIAA